jgi:hypothetical protein
MNTDGKIVIPSGMRSKIFQWYHTILWPKMQSTVHNVCSKCPSCQKNKPKLQKLGHLPPMKKVGLG